MAVHTAYRNDLAYRIEIGTRMPPITQENRFDRVVENDEAVSLNYSRIVNQWIERGSSRKQSGEDMDDVEEELYGELQSAIEELFRDPQLILNGLGAPHANNIFEFNKGTSHGLSYEHLSGGEKAALDLLLDIIVAKAEFNNTVFCIDEPEAHMHTKLQGPLLGKLYDLVPENSQLWIATHSIQCSISAALWTLSRFS